MINETKGTTSNSENLVILNRTTYDSIFNTIERLMNENKQWETNYNNLSAEFEEVSAIAQAQAEQIKDLQRAFVIACGGK